MSPIISVIVPVYNVAPYLENSITTIMQQSISDIQIILVNDGSSDESGQICERLADKDSRVEYICNEKNSGVSYTRNKGLEQANGQYVYFADADDKLDSDTLEFLLSLYKTEADCDLAVCGYYINDEPQKEKNPEIQIMSPSMAAKVFAGMNGMIVRGYLWNKLFRTELIKNNSLQFDTGCAICEDMLFCEQYIRYCRKIIYEPVPKYHYMVRGGSAMRGRVTAGRMTVFRAYEKIAKVCREYHDLELNGIIEGNHMRHYITIMKYLRKDVTPEEFIYFDEAYKMVKNNFRNIWFHPYIDFKSKIILLHTLILYHVKRRRAKGKKK